MNTSSIEQSKYEYELRSVACAGGLQTILLLQDLRALKGTA